MRGFGWGWLRFGFFLGGLFPVAAHSSFQWDSMPYCIRALHAEYQHFRLAQNMAYFSDEGRLAFEYGATERSEALFEKAFQAILDRQTLMTRFEVSFPELALIENALVAYYEPDLAVRPTFVGLLLSYISRPIYSEKVSYDLEGWDEVAVQAELQSEDVVRQQKRIIESRTSSLLSRLLFSLHRDLASVNVDQEEKERWCRSRSLLQGIREVEATLAPDDEHRKLALNIRERCREIIRSNAIRK